MDQLAHADARLDRPAQAEADLAPGAYGPSDLGWYVGANHTPDESLAGTSRAHRLSGALKHVGKQGPLFANVLGYDGSAKEGKVSAGYIMPAGEKMLTVRVALRAAVGENVIIHGVDADQGDPVLLARPTNRVETPGEQEFRRRTERAF